MPVTTCEKNGERGFKWGEHGVCFIGPGAREKAEAVGSAIKAKEGSENASSTALGINPPKPNRKRAV